MRVSDGVRGLYVVRLIPGPVCSAIHGMTARFSAWYRGWGLGRRGHRRSGDSRVGP